MIDGWKTYKLSEIATISNGKSKPNSIGNIPVYGGNGILGYTNNFNSCKEVIIIGRVGAYCGSVYFEDRPIWLSDNAMKAVCLEGFDNKFIYYLLKHLNLNQMAGGSSQPLLTQSTLNEISIIVPPLPQQTAIASILSALDDKIELNLQQNKTLEEMAMALFKHWFVDFGPFKEGNFIDSELGRIPEGWEVKSLNSLCEFSNGFAFKSTDLLKDEEEDCFHVFKMGHILKGGGLKSEGTKSWIKKEKCVKIEKYILKIGDILMSMTDMKDNMTILGHTALMNENNKFIVNQRVGLIRMKNSIEIDYPYIYITTNNKEYIEKLRSQANSGVQVNLSTDAIKNSKILAPSINVNSEFNVLVKPLFEKLNQNSIENQSLKEQRDSLLPKLISGEIKLKTFG